MTKEQRAAYDLGRQHAGIHMAAVEHYNTRPPDRCPYAKGSPLETFYDRGWIRQMADFRRTDRRERNAC